ncbi:MAG: histidinol-phosphate transaminase [Acidimicrobiales bacterium]
MPAIRPQLRDDLSSLDGYHSPQLDVDVRLNTNEAPGPPPAGFSAAVAQAVRSLTWNRYPDRSASRLRSKLAERYGLEMGNLFAANGSNEIIQSVLLAFGGHGRSIAVFEPTYTMHSQIARSTGTGVISAQRAADFSLDIAEVERVISQHRPAVIFLCSPNNPTGIVDPPGTVSRVLSLVESYGGLLFVDEAYGQFAAQSAIDLVSEERSLVVSRTFSKTWSMAAARLGYLVGPSWLIESLELVVLPYHLDSITQIAGEIALDYADEMAARVAHLVEERGRLTTAMTDLPLQLWPSGANFVLFRPSADARVDGAMLWQQLVEHSILVRNCSSWDRLDGCLRVTVGTREEDDQFLAALRALLS